VTTIVPQTETTSFHPRLIHFPSEQTGAFSARSIVPPLRQGDHVLHEEWGFGRVTGSASSWNGEVKVRFERELRKVAPDRLRRVVPRTIMAQAIVKRSGGSVTAWMVRKADEEGSIEPDHIGRFAGHAVHYFDEARIPALTEQLARRDSWKVGDLVIHESHGPGRVAAWQQRTNGPAQDGKRLVKFFGHSSPIVVEVAQLRRMLPSSVVAKRLGFNRKTFARLARRKGVCADYVTSGSRLREFFDESRVEAIRKRCSDRDRSESLLPGTLVLDRGQLARIEFHDARGQLHIRHFDASGMIQAADPGSLRRLVCLRELARCEGMSRYKLSRLLAAAGVRPVHRGGQAIYFDLEAARAAVSDRLGRETSALPLDVVAGRTGVSAAVLARKVRLGCIATTGQATHAVDAREAERIGEVVRTLHSGREGLEALGVCRLCSRGRNGQEVAAWDIRRLVKVAQGSTPAQRRNLFDQVAWLCEGAGKRRLIEAIKGYIFAHYSSSAENRNGDREAQMLLALLGRLPEEFAPYRNRAALFAAGVSPFYETSEELRSLALAAGFKGDDGDEKFRDSLDESTVTLLTCERVQRELGSSEAFAGRADFLYPDDDFARGAVIASLSEGKAEVGLIVRVERQAWNTLRRCWDKTVLVRFGGEERRVNPHARTSQAPQEINPRAFVLLRAADTMAVLQRMREYVASKAGPGEFAQALERQAS
jgi:hypothetical protein